MPLDPTPGHRYRVVSKATGHELAVNAHLGGPEIMHVVPFPSDRATRIIWAVESADVGLRLTTRVPWTNEPGDDVGRLDSNLERQVYVHRPNEGAFQKWRPIPDGEGYWQLVNVATGFALDGSDQDIFTMRPNDGSFQRWGFLPD